MTVKALCYLYMTMVTRKDTYTQLIKCICSKKIANLITPLLFDAAYIVFYMVTRPKTANSAARLGLLTSFSSLFLILQLQTDCMFEFLRV